MLPFLQKTLKLRQTQKTNTYNFFKHSYATHSVAHHSATMRVLIRKSTGRKRTDVLLYRGRFYYQGCRRISGRAATFEVAVWVLPFAFFDILF